MSNIKRKKTDISVAIIIYLNYIVDDSLKTIKLNNIQRSILNIWRNNANLHRISFDLFVLTVNLNLYCSSEAFEVRANRLYCVCLTSVNYGIVANFKTLKQVQQFLKQKGEKMQFSLPVQIYSAPTYLQEVAYTVSGTLLIDTNLRVSLYVQSFAYRLRN